MLIQPVDGFNGNSNFLNHSTCEKSTTASVGTTIIIDSIARNDFKVLVRPVDGECKYWLSFYMNYSAL